MALRPLRRLDVSAGDSLYDQLQSRTLHNVSVRRADIDAIPPALIVRDGDNILAAMQPRRARLVYGFASAHAFVDQFPDMFDKLLPKIRKTLDAGSVRFRLSHSPSRPIVEPVLKRLWFSPQRGWIEFRLDRATKSPAAPTASGVRLRDGGPDDFADLLRLDAEAFPDTPADPDAFRSEFDHTEVLVAMAGKRIAGYCIFWLPQPGEGWISDLAVTPEARGRGIGAALMARATKRLFAAGAQRIGLTTDDDNGDAMRLYQRLGFKQSGAGRDYTRPTDPAIIEQMRKDAQGTLIRFGGWR